MNEIEEEFRTAKSRLVPILEATPSTRNCDKFLGEIYYRHYEDIEVQLTQVQTPMSTINRVRAEIQAERIDLAPTDPKVRKNRESRRLKIKKHYGGEDNETYF